MKVCTAGLVVALLVAGVASCAIVAASGDGERLLELSLQRRDPGTGEVRVEKVKVASSRCAIVVVDMWEFHWCATWCGRAAAMIPRINRTLDVARKLGMTVVFAPTECADIFSGTPQREKMAALPRHPLPKQVNVNLPGFPVGGACMCGGPYPCVPNFGHFGQDPRLVVAKNDLVSSTAQEMYNLCQERGITHLIYTGGATNECLVNKPEAMVAMTRLGVQCIIARELNEAMTGHQGSASADANTARCVAHIEKHLAPSIHLENELRKAGVWKDDWVVDPVLMAPWGFETRPRFFNDKLPISLSVPGIRVAGAKIRYTTDGSEPKADSLLYTKPFDVRKTTTVRAVAFKGGKKVSLESSGRYVQLPPRPPAPDVHISDLAPTVINMAGWNVHDRPNPGHGPRKNRSYTGADLSVRGDEFKKGMGLRAPCQMVYELKPEYESFVALAGVDNRCYFDAGGRGRAGYPSVVFKVFIDGELKAESPVMRFADEPWRFSVNIPKGGRVISLVATDAGDGNREDIVVWGNAGFVLKK